jgi:chaperonin GroEL
MKKIINYDSSATEGLRAGVNKLAKAVTVTLGPSGCNVVISKPFIPSVATKDGVTVAKEVNLSDPLENTGAQMVKEVALKANELSGDGTSTAIVLANSIINVGFDTIEQRKIQPIQYKRGIDLAVKDVVAMLEKISTPLRLNSKRLKDVVNISSNGDKDLTREIIKAYKGVGKHGIVTIEESKGNTTYADIVPGMQFDRGYISPYFINVPGKSIVEFHNPLILIADSKIKNPTDILNYCEYAINEKRPLYIIAEDVEGEALSTLVVNKLNGVLDVVCVRAHGFGDRRRDNLFDLAILTGGALVSESLGHTLSKANPEFVLGSAKKIIVTKETTTIVAEPTEEQKLLIDKRIVEIQAQIDCAVIPFDKLKQEERLARLIGGVAIVYVGANSDLEIGEIKDRADDASKATRAALAEGIVPGGGRALEFIATSLNNTLDNIAFNNNGERVGYVGLLKALFSPSQCIAENAGLKYKQISEDKSVNYGLDASTGQYVDLMEAGIVDPKKVTRVALESAASIAGMILTTACTIVGLESKGESEFESIE